MKSTLREYELLLAEAARLHEKYAAARQEQFNVFTVLRSPADEVNLHSRFLSALLDHRKTPDAKRQNLTDFVCSVIKLKAFEAELAEVRRESDDIDILINDRNRAVVIENKIWAADQHRQLERYHQQVQDEGYGKVTLVYLSIDGREPTDDSLGHLPRDAVLTVSYGELLPWLERCSERAHDEPALRESLAQYRRLVKQLIGENYSGEHMQELEELLLEKGNLTLAYDLSHALLGAKVRVLRKLFSELESELDRKLSGLTKDGRWSITSPGQLEKYVRGEKGSLYWGLSYAYRENVHLAVELGHEVYYGVSCPKEHDAERRRVEDVLGKKNETAMWPWLCYPTTRLRLRDQTNDFIRFADDRFRKEYIRSISDELDQVREKLSRNGLSAASSLTET